MMIGILPIDEVKKAPTALRKAAECGVDEAWIQLGAWLSAPPFGEPDFAAADETLRSAVTRGVPGAPLALARLRWHLCRDDTSPRDQREAFDLLQVEVTRDQSNAEALHLLGQLTCAGFGTERSAEKAFELQRASAARGNTDAMFELYIHYINGLGVARNEKAALEANRQAAEAGHPRASYNMGAFFATGWGVEKDSSQAAEWYSRAADAGSVRALASLAVMYATGEGVARDPEQARLLFDEADYLGLDVEALRTSVGL